MQSLPLGIKTPISDWQKKELILPGVIPRASREVISLSVPLNLEERRIYLYLEVAQSAAGAFVLETNLKCKQAGNVLAQFPAAIADFTAQTPNQSILSLFNAGGSPVGDSCVIRLAQPFVATVVAAVIQPLRVNGQFDEITLDIVNANGATVTGWRAFLACLSTKY